MGVARAAAPPRARVAGAAAKALRRSLARPPCSTALPLTTRLLATTLPSTPVRRGLQQAIFVVTLVCCIGGARLEGWPCLLPSDVRGTLETSPLPGHCASPFLCTATPFLFESHPKFMSSAAVFE